MNDRSAEPNPTLLAGTDVGVNVMTAPGDILLWTCDATGLCNFVSPSWTKFTGRAKSKELGHGWLDHVHADDRDSLQQGLQEACSKQQPFQLTFRHLREDSIYCWMMSHGMPHTTPSDELMGYLCFCFEVAPDKVGDVEMERVVQNVFPLLKQTRLVAVTLDLQGRVQFANDALRHLLQCSAAELIGCRLFETRLATGARSLLEQLYPGGTQSANFPAEFQSELLRHDQQSRHVAWHAVVWRDAAGRAMGSILIGNDVTELLREEKKTSLYISAFEATAHAIVVTDTQGSIISVNRAFTQLTGYSRDEALGQNPRILQSGKHEPAFYEQMWKTITASGHWHGDVWDRRKDGSIYPKYLSISAIKNSSGALTNYVGIFFDNSERHTLEERLDQLAHYDALTGLPNRSLLLDRLEQAVERAIRLGTKVGLIYLDLDHFKHVNDSFGHFAGDQLLKAVAKRAKTCVRAVDTVARLGGDEFVILVPDAHDQDDISTLANKLLAALTPPYEIEGRSATSTPSIGISIYPDDGANVDDLMKLADTAMYQAKQSGRANFKFFNDTSCHIKGNDDLFTKDVSPA
jgi:diguanylate cyclase (GGDEF)-like protein/PAS domain S-box-containing protein